MSSNSSIISVSNVSKHFHMYDRPENRLKQMVSNRLHVLFGLKHKTYFEDFVALKNISFEIPRGQTIGIVGRNGSGKSTLLQIICGTLMTSSGTVETRGRVAALLELGAGFNPEFTGRENVFLNGAILGLSKAEILEKFDDVAEFAGIGTHMDQPVKTYSSGMYVRLAFSVATVADPQILVIDEALAVGDEAFQRKCIQRFEKMRRNGTTILLVSHSAQTIVQLCDRVLLLDDGEVIMDGHPNTVIANYQKMMDLPRAQAGEIRQAIVQIDGNSGAVADAHAIGKNTENTGSNKHFDQSWLDVSFTCQSTAEYPPDGAEISNVQIIDKNNRSVNMLISGEEYRISVEILFTQSLADIGFSTLIKTLNGVEIAGVASGSQKESRLHSVKTGERYQIQFEFSCLLKAGTYFINSGVVSRDKGARRVLHRMVDAYMFKVFEAPTSIQTGMVDLGLLPKWKLLADDTLG